MDSPMHSVYLAAPFQQLTSCDETGETCTGITHRIAACICASDRVQMLMRHLTGLQIVDQRGASPDRKIEDLMQLTVNAAESFLQHSSHCKVAAYEEIAGCLWRQFLLKRLNAEAGWYRTRALITGLHSKGTSKRDQASPKTPDSSQGCCPHYAKSSKRTGSI